MTESTHSTEDIAKKHLKEWLQYVKSKDPDIMDCVIHAVKQQINDQNNEKRRKRKHHRNANKTFGTLTLRNSLRDSRISKTQIIVPNTRVSLTECPISKFSISSRVDLLSQPKDRNNKIQTFGFDDGTLQSVIPPKSINVFNQICDEVNGKAVETTKSCSRTQNQRETENFVRSELANFENRLYHKTI